jgi:hypothetical protein
VTSALAIVAVVTKYVCRDVLRLDEAYDYYVIPEWWRWIDFRCFALRFRDFHHATFFAHDARHNMIFTYPAPAALVYEFFYRIRHGMMTYDVAGSSVIGWAGYRLARAMQRRGAGFASAALFLCVCGVASYPLYVNFWLGNTELVLGVLLGFGLYFVLKEKSWAAATCLGFAASLKIYPLLFLLLLLPKKHYRQIAYALALFVVVNLVGLWAMSGSVARSWAGVNEGLEYYKTNYALTFHSHDFALDHSLWAEIKGTIYALCAVYPGIDTMAMLMRIFLATTGVGILALYFARIRKLPVLSQVLCLCVIALSVSPGSKEYTLMNLYVPWGFMILLVVEAYRDKRTVPGLAAAMTCFLLLFVALNEFIVGATVLNGVIKGVILLALLGIGLKYPFGGREQPELSGAREISATPS